MSRSLKENASEAYIRMSKVCDVTQDEELNQTKTSSKYINGIYLPANAGNTETKFFLFVY